MTALLSDELTPASFDDFGLPAPLLAALAEAGISRPFAIQAATLPDALAGRDILGRAKTGSGKTLGFSLPMVARLAEGPAADSGRPRGLVLVPTRELATQVQRVLRPLAHAMGLDVTTVFGGTPFRPQVNALRQGTDIVVACPGRLADLIDRGHCDLGDVAITVLDEADHMTDLGFLPVVRRLLEATPADGQRLLFSATLDSAIDVLARRFLSDPARHSVDAAAPPAEMTHHLLTVSPGSRVDVLMALVGGDRRSLIFTRTKYGAKRLAGQLGKAGIPAAELHGDLSQNARDRNLGAFAGGQVRVLVATDIAARGIHVDGVDLVIHADPPAEHKAYLHRSGRTARGGAGGTVVTIQVPAQSAEVGKLMRKAGVSPACATVDADSAVVTDLAGPPAPRVFPSRPRADSDRRERKPRAGGTRPGRTERSERAERGERPSRARDESGGARQQSGGSRHESRRRSQPTGGRSHQSGGGSHQPAGRSREAGGPSRPAAPQGRGRTRRTEVRGRGA